MKVLVVLHAKNPNWGFDIKAPLENLEGFENVAALKDVDLDDAFRLTNTIDAPWFEAVGPDKALFWVKGPARSTSVGDVILVIEPGAPRSGEVKTTGFVVAGVGFTEFDPTGMVVGGPNTVPPAALNG